MVNAGLVVTVDVVLTVTEGTRLANHAVLCGDLKARNARIERSTGNGLVSKTAFGAVNATAVAEAGMFLRPQVACTSTDERRNRNVVDAELLQVEVIQSVNKAAIRRVFAASTTALSGAAAQVGPQVGAFHFSAQAVAKAPAKGAEAGPAAFVPDFVVARAAGVCTFALERLGLGQVVAAANVNIRTGDGGGRCGRRSRCHQCCYE